MKENGRYRIWSILGISCLLVILPCAGYGADLSIGNTVSTTGNWTVNGTLSATSFSGGGSGLSGVNAALLNGQSAQDIMGAVADTRSTIEACGTISQSGSYYVTQNLTTTGTCITVTANDVTIDLNGFTLTGDGSANNYGIYIYNASNVEVRNGTVRGFYTGIYGYWDSGPATRSNRVINVRAMGNGYRGIYLGSYNNLLKDCSATDSASSSGSGIYASLGSTVTGNIAYNNQGDGIAVGSGVTVTGNTVYDNKHNGIYAGDGVTVAGNTVYNNQWDGVQAGSGSTVTNNTVYANNQSNETTYAGIQTNSGCIVKNNTLRGNLQNNIRVDGSDNAIEENLLTNSGNGIWFLSSGNFYANNRARGNTVNYYTAGHTETDGGGNVSF